MSKFEMIDTSQAEIDKLRMETEDLSEIIVRMTADAGTAIREIKRLREENERLQQQLTEAHGLIYLMHRNGCKCKICATFPDEESEVTV